MLGGAIADLGPKPGRRHADQPDHRSGREFVLLRRAGYSRCGPDFFAQPWEPMIPSIPVDDLDFSLVAQARLMHFGYPPLMKRMFRIGRCRAHSHLFTLRKRDRCFHFARHGAARPVLRIRQGGLGFHILSATLPQTDIFMPSIEEIIYMARPQKNTMSSKRKDSDILKNLDIDYISDLGGRILISMGCGIVVSKMRYPWILRQNRLGRSRLSKMGRAAASKTFRIGQIRELFSGIYKVENFKSATGAGDTSIAGFLAAFLQRTVRPGSRY